MFRLYNIRQIVKILPPGGPEYEAMIYGFGTDNCSYLVMSLPGATEDEKFRRVVAEEWIVMPGDQQELIKKVKQAGL